jgi:hypothetical protein
VKNQNKVYQLVLLRKRGIIKHPLTKLKFLIKVLSRDTLLCLFLNNFSKSSLEKIFEIDIENLTNRRMQIKNLTVVNLLEN